jgi:hypothetical protein
MWFSTQSVYVLNGDRVRLRIFDVSQRTDAQVHTEVAKASPFDTYLVPNVQTPHVFSIAFNQVNEIIHACIFPKQNVGVVHLVFMQNVVHGLARVWS